MSLSHSSHASIINQEFSDDLLLFIVLSTVNAFGFLFAFVQLLIVKPSSKKILIPIIIFTTTAFLILIALDFYLEIQLTHVTPRKSLTAEEKSEGKTRFKMGYLIIYGEDLTHFLELID